MMQTPETDLPFQGPPVPPPGSRSKPSILVVEDEPSICRAVAISYTRAGYNAVTTTSGDGAMYHLRTQYFDMMLVDLRLPDMRGDVVFHLAASLQPQLRTQTVFMTGDVTEQASNIIEDCSCALLMKPFDLIDLNDTTSAVLATTEFATRMPERRVQIG